MILLFVKIMIFLYLLKNKMILLFVKFMTTKKVRIFSPSFLLLLEPGSKIEDLGWEEISIWDKHPLYATLYSHVFCSYCQVGMVRTGTLFAS